jgi:hypothetical protein
MTGDLGTTKPMRARVSSSCTLFWLVLVLLNRAYDKPHGSIAAAQRPCAYKCEVPACGTPGSTDVNENKQVTDCFAPNDVANIAAEAAMLAPCLRDILPKVLSSGLQLCRKNRQVTDCFAPNDVANIAAEAAMLAPCMRDILPKMERHKCNAKYLRRNRHSTSTTCLMKYKCALLWCLEGVPVWHWGRPVK